MFLTNNTPQPVLLVKNKSHSSQKHSHKCHGPIWEEEEEEEEDKEQVEDEEEELS